MNALKIGEVVRRTGLTERALRYYEELGLLRPERVGGGHRVYDQASLARLYRIRLLRELGTPLGEIPHSDVDADLLATTRRHLADVDRRLTELSALRERVRTVESSLKEGEAATDEDLFAVLSGMGGDEQRLSRRLTLLVYRDLAATYDFLIRVFGLAAGTITRQDGVAVHAELFAGDGVVWLHRESEEFALASPATVGASTASMAIMVDDLDRHFERVQLAAGAEVVYPPRKMPYGVREYGARDPEGGLWSFMQELDEEEHE